MVLAAVLPLLQKLMPKAGPLKTPPCSALPIAFLTTPRKYGLLSPLLTTSSELHVCLDDFLKLKGINLLDIESALAALSLTPDIRELAQKPHEPRAAFLHCAELHRKF
jgi:hypothetical protein